MRIRGIWLAGWLLVALALGGLSGGCRRRAASVSAAPAVQLSPNISPVSNLAPEPPKLEQPPTGSDRRDARVAIAAQPEAGKLDARPAAEGGEAKAVQDAAPDPEKAQRRAAIEAADSALEGISGALKGCLDREPGSAQEVKLRFGLRETGYAMAPSVSGVSAPAKRCIEGLIEQLHVQGVNPGGITIERTLRTAPAKR